MRDLPLVAVYQPICEIATGRVCAVEALSRRADPDGRLVEPDAWLAALPVERQLRVDCWMLRHAVGEAVAAGAPLVCVNLFAAYWQHPRLWTHLDAALHVVEGMPVVIELHEGSRLGPEALERLAGWRDRGLRLALDDWGAPSSPDPDEVASWPIDGIKLDRQWLLDATDADVVATVSWARAHHWQVVAEGVEDERAAARMHRLGIRYGQGWHWQRPEADLGRLRLAG